MTVFFNFTMYDIIYIYKKKKCDALRDLVSFFRSKKREKHPKRSVTFVAGWYHITKSVSNVCFNEKTPEIRKVSYSSYLFI